MAWEIKTKPDILVGVLHTWSLHPDWTLSMLRLQKAPFGKRTVLSYRFEHDKPYDTSRNFLAKECLESGAEWLFMVDSDVVVPAQTLERLLSHKVSIVGGLYWRRHPKIFAEAFKFRPGTTQYDPIPDQNIYSALNEVDGIGAGCLLIHRRVFENLKDKVKKLTIPAEGNNVELYEFFKFTSAEPPYVSEDLFFCIQARLAGWKIYLDGNVKCGHILSTMMIKDGRPDWTPLEKGVD